MNENQPFPISCSHISSFPSSSSWLLDSTIVFSWFHWILIFIFLFACAQSFWLFPLVRLAGAWSIFTVGTLAVNFVAYPSYSPLLLIFHCAIVLSHKTLSFLQNQVLLKKGGPSRPQPQPLTSPKSTYWLIPLTLYKWRGQLWHNGKGLLTKMVIVLDILFPFPHKNWGSRNKFMCGRYIGLL